MKVKLFKYKTYTETTFESKKIQTNKRYAEIMIALPVRKYLAHPPQLNFQIANTIKAVLKLQALLKTCN